MERPTPDEPAPQPATGPRRTQFSLLWVVPLLLLLAVAADWEDVRAVASGRRTLAWVLHGQEAKKPGRAFSFPPPAGPADARIKVQVIAREESCCQRPLVALWLGISDLEPQRLRLEFVPSTDMGRIAPKGQHRPLQTSVECGVVINGQNGFAVGSGPDKRTLYLNGPCPDPNLTAGRTNVPRGHGWTSDNLATIVNRLIGEKYGQPGHLTGAAIEAAGRAADARIPAAKPVPVGRAR